MLHQVGGDTPPDEWNGALRCDVDADMPDAQVCLSAFLPFSLSVSRMLTIHFLCLCLTLVSLCLCVLYAGVRCRMARRGSNADHQS